MDGEIGFPYGVIWFLNSSPVARWMILAMVLFTGALWASSKRGTGIRKLTALAFGGALALGATNLLVVLFGG